MAKPAKLPLTKLELQIMQVIWREGAGTVADIQESLASELAYTTVQTMLNILCRKGKIKRELRGRAFVYKPAVTHAKASLAAARDLIDRMFGGSSEDLVMSLLTGRQIDPEKNPEPTRRLKEEEGSR